MRSKASVCGSVAFAIALAGCSGSAGSLPFDPRVHPSDSGAISKDGQDQPLTAVDAETPSEGDADGDVNSGQDAGPSHLEDAGSRDATPAPDDAGAPERDAGPTPTDAGEHDAGHPPAGPCYQNSFCCASDEFVGCFTPPSTSTNIAACCKVSGYQPTTGGYCLPMPSAGACP